MSVYSTLTVSRQQALAKYYEITGTKQLSKKFLEDFLDSCFEHTCYNFIVLSGDDPGEDDACLNSLLPED